MKVAKKEQRTLQVVIMVNAKQKAIIEAAAAKEMESSSTWGLKKLLAAVDGAPAGRK
jgi:hypothetical protein